MILPRGKLTLCILPSPSSKLTRPPQQKASHKPKTLNFSHKRTLPPSVNLHCLRYRGLRLLAGFAECESKSCWSWRGLGGRGAYIWGSVSQMMSLYPCRTRMRWGYVAPIGSKLSARSLIDPCLLLFSTPSYSWRGGDPRWGPWITDNKQP